VGDLTYRGLDLQDGGIWLDLVSGFAEPPAVRGDDVVIPGKVGRTWMPKVGDHRTIELRGYVLGSGHDLEARQSSWRELTDELMAVLAFDAAPGTLEVAGPYLGIPAGFTYSIQAAALNAVGGDVESTMTYQLWSIQLEAYGVGGSLAWSLDS
jgi:hypothetical protein